MFQGPEYVCVHTHILLFKYLYKYHTFLKRLITFKPLAKNMAFKVSQNKYKQDYPAQKKENYAPFIYCACFAESS